MSPADHCRGAGGAGGGGNRFAEAAAGFDGLRVGGFCTSGAGGSAAALPDVEPVGSALMMLTGGIEADEGKLNRDVDDTADGLAPGALGPAAGAIEDVAGGAAASTGTLPGDQLATYCVICASNACSFKLAFTRLV